MLHQYDATQCRGRYDTIVSMKGMSYGFGCKKGRNGADVFFADMPPNAALQVISVVL